MAELLEASITPIAFKRFPDGESYIKFGAEVKGEDVIVVQSMGPPQDSHLLQAMLMVDTARELGARSITLVAPYIAYARQDRRFLEGEALSLRTVVRLLSVVGVEKLVTVNSHSPAVLGELGQEFGVAHQDLSAIPVMASWFKARGLEGAFSITLGKRAISMAIEADKVLGGGYACLETERDLETGKPVIKSDIVGVAGKTVIIFDDIISTGGTMVEAVKRVKARGASDVHVACVHPLLVDGALEKILSGGAVEVVATNAIESPVSVVSIAPLIVDALKRQS
jgi:ribose-phosphate pyrophosphokinase